MFEKRNDLIRFLAVVDTGKVLGAANDLAITQPALTRVIARLEKQFGGRLFERLPQGMRPTQLGNIAAGLSRHILGEIEVAEQKVNWTVSGRSGALRLTAGPMWMQAVLPTAMSRFREAFPGIELKLRTTSFAEGIRRLAAGESDLHCGGLDTNEPLPPFIARDRFIDVTAGVVAHKDHPLHTGTPTIDDLADYPWIDYGPPPQARTPNDGPSPGRVLDGLYEHTGKRVATLIRTSSTGLFPMATGPYLAWLPLTFLERLPDLFLKALQVEFARVRYRAGVAFRRSANDLAPVRRFREIVKETALERYA